MSTGGGKTEMVTQRTEQNPWSGQQPFLTKGFQEAERIYGSDQPQYYPQSTVVPFSPESNQALSMTANRATQGNPLLPQSQQLASDTLGGNYLSGNPFFAGAFQSQVKPMVEQYTNQLVPGLNSAFSSAGRVGSGAHQNAAGQAQDSFARALSDTAGKLAFQNYGQERGLMQEAAQFAPALAQADYMDPMQLGAVGAARESQGQAELQDSINRYNFNQNLQANKLAQFMGLVGGGYGSQGTSTMPVQSRNPFLGLMGGALGGGLLGNMIFPGQGGSAAGAGLGGLMGLMG